MLGLAAFFVVALVFCAKAFEPVRGQARIVRRWIGGIGAVLLGLTVGLIVVTTPEVHPGMLGVLVTMFFVSASAFFGSLRKPPSEPQ